VKKESEDSEKGKIYEREIWRKKILYDLCLIFGSLFGVKTTKILVLVMNFFLRILLLFLTKKQKLS